MELPNSGVAVFKSIYKRCLSKYLKLIFALHYLVGLCSIS